jgi:hypothetical protein
MYFSETLVDSMITGSLIFISVAVVVLVTLLIMDIKNKKLW